HTRFSRDWSSDVCSSDLVAFADPEWARFHFLALAKGLLAQHLAVWVEMPTAQTLDGQLLRLDTSNLWLQREAAPSIPVQRAQQRSEERRVGKEGRPGREA